MRPWGRSTPVRNGGVSVTARYWNEEAETLGAATLLFGVGNSRRLLVMMDQLKDELASWATPSYAVRLATALDGRRHSRETLGRSCGRQGSSP